ncbi:hypothetical protein [Streptomyces sp. NPDC056264]|uniref:hypothetical protein n=1 Tax=Streptomyces sp. NPDC056264 TaxID=3345767 RepID=UPI003AB0466C
MLPDYEFPGLVIEDSHGRRLVAIPTSELGILRYADVIQFKGEDGVLRRFHLSEPPFMTDADEPITHTTAPDEFEQQPARLRPVPPAGLPVSIPTPREEGSWICLNIACRTHNGAERSSCYACETRRGERG